MSSLLYALVYPNVRKGEVENSGGYVEIHSTHHNHETERNLLTAIMLAKQGLKIRLLPIDTTPHVKNPDAYIINEGIAVEFKHNLTPTRSAIEESIRKGRHQADHLVIHILSEITRSDLIKGVRNRMYFARNVMRLWLIWSGEVHHFTRDEIFDGTLEQKIK